MISNKRRTFLLVFSLGVGSVLSLLIIILGSPANQLNNRLTNYGVGMLIIAAIAVLYLVEKRKRDKNQNS